MSNVTMHYAGFRRWVGVQTGPYQYKDPTTCPMANYAREKHGFASPSAGMFHVFDKDTRQSIDLVGPGYGGLLLEAISYGPLTYEALTKRLDVYFTKTGLRRRRQRRAPYVPTGPLGSFKRGAVS